MGQVTDGTDRTHVGTVLCIGVTGGTGHQAVRGLVAEGVTDLVALTRDPAKPTSRALERLGVRLVSGDLDDDAALGALLADVDAVYLHALSHDTSVADPQEADRGRRLAGACARHGIGHVVYNSADGCDRGSGVPHMDAVREVELAFEAVDVPFTALRATLFMEEYWKGHNRPDILQGSLRLAHPDDFVQRFLAVRDLGRIAAMVLGNRDRWIGKAIELATDALTPVELAGRFSAAQERPVSYHRLPEGFFAAIPGTDELLRIIEWYEDEGYTADVGATHATFPGCWDFATFLAATDWGDTERSYASFSDGTLEAEVSA